MQATTFMSSQEQSFALFQNNEQISYRSEEQSTFIAMVMPPQEQSLALLQNITMMQSQISRPLQEELERSSLALRRFREEAGETHRSLVERVVQLESERPAFEMRINEMNRAHEAEKVELNRSIQNLKAELRATQAESAQKTKIIKDYDDALESIKKAIPTADTSTMCSAPFYYLIPFLNTCREQLRKVKKLI